MEFPEVTLKATAFFFPSVSSPVSLSQPYISNSYSSVEVTVEQLTSLYPIEEALATGTAASCCQARKPVMELSNHPNRLVGFELIFLIVQQIEWEKTDPRTKA